MIKIVKPLGLLALAYCLVGPALYFTEFYLIDKQLSQQQVIPTILLATFFYVYTFISLLIFQRLLIQNSSSLTSFYLASKILRILVCILIIIIYGILKSDSLLVFAINLFILYIVTVVISSVYCIREENSKNKKHEVA